MNRREAFKAIGASAAAIFGLTAVANSSFQDNAFPGTALSFDGKPLSGSEIDALREKIRLCYQGVRRTSEPVVLRPGIKLVKVDW